MSKHTARERKQLERHIADLLEGTLSPADHHRLEAALAADADLRAYYLDYTRLHSLLHQSKVSPHDLGLPMSEQETGSNKAESGKRKAEDAATRQSPVAAHQSLRTWNRSLSRHRFGIGIAAGLVFVVGLIGWAAFTYLPNVAENEEPPAEKPIEWIALLNHAHEAEWLDGTKPPANRPRLMPGQRLAISAGVLEINYRTGARVIVEGPAEFVVGGKSGERKAESGKDVQPSSFTLHPSNSGYLAHGKLTARVVGEAAKDFVVDTPTAHVKDLGTEFSLYVSSAGITNLYVIDGIVAIASSEASAELEPVVVRAGEAVAVGKDTAQPQSIAYDIEPFKRTLPPKSVQIPLAQVLLRRDNLPSGSRGSGVDTVDGRYQTRSSRRRHGSGKFVAVPWNRFVEGVFVPRGGRTAITLGEGGTGPKLFVDLPKTSGMTYDFIRTSKNFDCKSTLDGIDYSSNGHTVVTLHTNSGITFDLAAIEVESNGGRAARLKGVVGLANADGSAEYRAYLDGKMVESIKLNRANALSGIPVDVPIARGTRFLTLVTTDTNQDVQSDQVVFGDSYLQIEFDEAFEEERR